MRTDENGRGSVLILALWAVALLSLAALSAGRLCWTEAKLTAFQIERIRDNSLLSAAIELAKAGLTHGLESLSKEAELSDGSISVRLEAEDDLINLNTATLGELESIPGMTTDAAAGIRDWRDPDSSTIPGGAENAYYQSLAAPYACRNGAFASLQELLLVRGVSPELFQQIRSQATVYGPGHYRAHVQIRSGRSPASNFEVVLKQDPAAKQWRVKECFRL